MVVLLTTDNLPEGAVAEVAALYREQLAVLPDHELIVMNGARHYVMFDAPDAVFRREEIASCPDELTRVVPRHDTLLA